MKDEITLPKAHLEIGGCEDILRGHCKEYEPNINGRFITDAQVEKVIAALYILYPRAWKPEDMRRGVSLWLSPEDFDEAKEALEILTGRKG